MDFKSVFLNSKKYFKKSLFYLGSSFAIFMTGFIVHYILNRKKRALNNDDSEIQEMLMSPEMLVKIVKKIANKVCHQMVLIHDSLQSYNPVEFSQEDQEGIQVEEIKLEKIQDADAGPVIEDNNKIITQISEADKQMITKTNMSEPEKMREELKKIFSSREKQETRLLLVELDALSKYKITPQQYITLLQENKNNEKIKEALQLIQEFKTNLNENKAININFGSVITDNYFKIISNIYYLNLRKAQKKFKSYYVDEGHNVRNNSTIFNNFYKEFLKETRNEVLEFFKYKETHPVLGAKELLRIYPHTLSHYHPLRLKYEQLGEEVNAVIRKIQIMGTVDQLMDDVGYKGPVDQIIDFKPILGSQKTTNINYDDMNFKTLNKFKQEYEDN